MESPNHQASPDSASVRTAPLRRFVLAALGLIVLAWSVAQFGAVRLLVERSYLQFETQDGLTNARRLGGFMTQEYERLLQVARDYAYWDDTAAFARGEQPDYVAQNFSDTSYENLHADIVLIGTPDGRPSSVT